MSSFSAFNLRPELKAVLDKLGYRKLSPVQEEAIPPLLRNESVVVKAPTGSGKTLAYLVPILNDLSSGDGVQALVVVPTKMLTQQVYAVLQRFKTLGYKLSVTALVDGSTALEKISSDLVIATPAMALAFATSANLQHLRRTILDEGDMLLFGGFLSETEGILSLHLHGSITIFTASISEHLDALVKRYIHASRLIDVGAAKITSPGVSHHLVDVRDQDKGAALVGFLKVRQPYKAIIFASEKRDLEHLGAALSAAGYSFALVHGDLEKREQKRAYNDFNRDICHLLLASDIASRGVDFPEVTDVISVDLPRELVYYFHRAGRAGRFDRQGDSYVFYSRSDPSRAKELLKKGTRFDFLTLKGGALHPDRDLATISRKKTVNAGLEAEIKKAVLKNRSTKVKPNYKKKVTKAVERAKERHRRKIIRTNLSKKDQSK